MIQCKRVYDAPAQNDGLRVLIDRLWPRGIKKTDLHYDLWEKELAPSATLRKEWHHGVIDFTVFKKDYQAELKENLPAAKSLIKKAQGRNLTLLYGAKDTQNNHARVLAEFLLNLSCVESDE